VSDPVQPRPQPVVDAGRLGGLVSGALVAVSSVFFLVQAGINPDSITALGVAVQGAVTAVVSLLAYLLPKLHAKHAATQVTPLSDPHDHQMRPLKVDPDFYGRHAAKAVPRGAVEYAFAHGFVDYERPYDRGGYIPGGPVPIVNTSGKPEPVITAEQARAAGAKFLDSLNRTDTQEIPRVTVQRIPEQIVPGKRLGRHVHHDPRSLSYLVPETSTPTTAMWTRRVPVFDQGDTGSCTGNAAAGVLGTDPFYATLPAGLVDDEGEAVKLYSAATALDDYPGTYPPDDTGSDGLSVAKAAQKAGLISGYQHITSVAAAQTAIVSGPFIVGVNWYTSMDNPDANGLVKVSGSIRGGHEFECHGYDAAADLWWFTNSWGTSYGKDGTFCMSSPSFARLLSEQGDATVFLPVAAPFPPVPQPPAPTPVPTPTPPAPVPTPVPTPTPTPPAPAGGFPLAEWDAYEQHHRSEIKWQRLKSAVDTWISGGGQ